MSLHINNINLIYNVFYSFKLQFTLCAVFVRILQKSRTNEMWRERERKYIILRNWIMQLWRLASPKSAGWASKLRT